MHSFNAVCNTEHWKLNCLLIDRFAQKERHHSDYDGCGVHALSFFLTRLYETIHLDNDDCCKGLQVPMFFDHKTPNCSRGRSPGNPSKHTPKNIWSLPQFQINFDGKKMNIWTEKNHHRLLCHKTYNCSRGRSPGNPSNHTLKFK